MQTPPAAGEAVFQVFDAHHVFCRLYRLGAAVLLDGGRYALDAAARSLAHRLYALAHAMDGEACWPRFAKGLRCALRPSRVGWWTAYTNIHSVKMFAHQDGEINFAREAIEEAASAPSIEEMRIYYGDGCLSVTLLNGVLIVGVVGWAI